METEEIAENGFENKKNSNKNRLFLIVLSALIFIGIVISGYYYYLIFGQRLTKFEKDNFVLIS